MTDHDATTGDCRWDLCLLTDGKQKMFQKKKKTITKT